MNLDLKMRFIPFLILFASLLKADTTRPNFLFAISDDQSYPHASAYGAKEIETPAFDRVASMGVLFHNAFVAAPQCSPNRAAILTGQEIWRLEEAGTHGSYFPSKFPVFTRRLEDAGYHVGYTGKPWSPGNWKDAGWDRNPVGTAYAERQLEAPTTGIKSNDYAANFMDFLKARKGDEPFFFWYGSSEPHLAYEYGSGRRAGKSLDEASPPPFLPDSEATRNDYLDYALEIEWFDRHLGQMIDALESMGELENTVIIVTSDNGMPFPYAKANLQEYGIHVPLAIAGPSLFSGGRVSESIVSHVDFAPSILELAGIESLPDATGISLVPYLKNGDARRSYALAGRERHTHARPENLGYPARAIRTEDYLYIWNLKPERWPAGNPIPEGLSDAQLDGSFSLKYKGFSGGFEDIDGSATKKDFLRSSAEHPDLIHLATGKRPEHQLYKVSEDPWCLNDLSRNPNYAEVLEELSGLLRGELEAKNDPRMGENGAIFESYPRFGGMRPFPGFSEQGEYNPDYIDE
ncbi:MAG: sulfatase [Verrucomicrobiota bacterium]